MAFAWTTPDTGETVQARFIDSPKYTLHNYVYYFADVLVEVLP
jgi:hypothetical protein